MKKPSLDPRTRPVDQWVQAAITGELISILQDEWLNILKIDRLAQSLDHLRQRCGMGGRGIAAAEQFEGLICLHCVYYDAMSEPTRAGLPTALLSVLGLDAQTGPVLLGESGWYQLECSYAHPGSDQNAPPRETVPTASTAAGKVSSSPQPCSLLLRLSMLGQSIKTALKRVRTVFDRARLGAATWIAGDLLAANNMPAKSAPSQPAWEHFETGCTPFVTGPSDRLMAVLRGRTGPLAIEPKRPPDSGDDGHEDDDDASIII